MRDSDIRQLEIRGGQITSTKIGVALAGGLPGHGPDRQVEIFSGLSERATARIATDAVGIGVGRRHTQSGRYTGKYNTGAGQVVRRVLTTGRDVQAGIQPDLAGIEIIHAPGCDTVDVESQVDIAVADWTARRVIRQAITCTADHGVDNGHPVIGLASRRRGTFKSHLHCLRAADPGLAGAGIGIGLDRAQGQGLVPGRQR